MVQCMNDTLNSIFVRLDVSLQNLSSKAIAQIIVKLLYKHGGRMKKQAIYEALANVNCCNHLANRDVDEILDKLSEREIQHKGGDYYLSQSKKEKIKKSIEESEERRKRILEKSHCFQFFCSIANLWGLVCKFHSVLDYADFLCNFQCIGNLFMQHSN